MRKRLLIAALTILSSAAAAQLPGLRKYPATPRGQPAPAAAPALSGIDALRADFLARSGGDTVYFGMDSAMLGAPAKPTLDAQALWLLQHPDVVVRIEGHGDPNDTRDHAIAMGARRAQEVRDYLMLRGVPAAQLSVMSWGKERPGAPRAMTVLVR